MEYEANARRSSTNGTMIALITSGVSATIGRFGALFKLPTNWGAARRLSGVARVRSRLLPWSLHCQLSLPVLGVNHLMTGTGRAIARRAASYRYILYRITRVQGLHDL
jgi:hypothetical protein